MTYKSIEYDEEDIKEIESYAKRLIDGMYKRVEEEIHNEDSDTRKKIRRSNKS